MRRSGKKPISVIDPAGDADLADAAFGEGEVGNVAVEVQDVGAEVVAGVVQGIGAEARLLRDPEAEVVHGEILSAVENGERAALLAVHRHQYRLGVTDGGNVSLREIPVLVAAAHD